MQQKRFQIYVQDDFSFQLVQSCRLWPEAVAHASSWQGNSKQSTYIVDSCANTLSEDVFRLDSFGNPNATGHLARSLYEQVELTPVVSLALSGVTEPLAVPGAVMLVKPLAEVGGEAKTLTGGDNLLTMSAEFEVLASPFPRHPPAENDIALMVYCEQALIATAVFSRYIEDHRFPVRQSELCYELSLHTVFVAEQYRGLGIATSLAYSIVNIARKDMLRLHQVLTDGNIRLKPWFTALALTPGGEAICDILSEAFVEMNDDVIDELMDGGVAISYQEPEVYIESLV